MTARAVIRNLFGLFIGTAILAGCSIKEDREPCPVYLSVGFSDRESITHSVGLVGWNGEGPLFHSVIDVKEYDPYWVKAVHRGFVSLSAYTGAESSYVSDRRMVIPMGHQADSLYAFFREVDCTGDDAYVDVVFRKQFCTVHLDLNQKEERLSRFRFLVEGGTCGFNLDSFAAVEGPFSCSPSARPGETIVDFRIPRQVDSSLKITMWFLNEETNQYDLIGEYPLGEMIAKTGYNWKEESLQDVYVKIGIAFEYFEISIGGWEDGVVFTFIEQ